MKSRRRTTIIAATCLALSMAASIVLLRRVDQIHPNATLDEGLYLRSPKALKRLSLGYNGLMADIYWTRTVQYFGGRLHARASEFNLLAPLLEITTALDPHLTVAYEFGSNFLAPAPPNGAGMPDRAVRLMEYGIQNNPSDWKLYYDLGFVYYMDVKDYAKAAAAFERGSKVPEAHPFMKVLAAQMAQHAGEFETARALWSASYQTSQDRQIRDNALEHLRALKVDEDVTQLQAAVTRFGERTGRLPSNMSELALAAGLRGIPVDPDGNPYKLTPEGRVLVENPDDFAFLTKGIPPGYKPAPPKFHANH